MMCWIWSPRFLEFLLYKEVVMRTFAVAAVLEDGRRQWKNGNDNNEICGVSGKW
jgi:hypothetical protein